MDLSKRGDEEEEEEEEELRRRRREAAAAAAAAAGVDPLLHPALALTHPHLLPPHLQSALLPFMHGGIEGSSRKLLMPSASQISENQVLNLSKKSEELQQSFSGAFTLILYLSVCSLIDLSISD